ncbi:MAG: class I adenylate-forming enzyme family protein [Myxococcota bacterium]
MTPRTRVPPAMARVEAELLARGAPFEIAEEEISGARVRVFVNRPRSLRDLLLRAREFGDAEYLVFRDGDRDRRYTFAAHEGAVAATAAALRERHDVRPGDRVAILAANCPEWVITFWATVSLGAICVGLNGWWTENEIRYALQHARPKVLIADRKRAARLVGDVGTPMVVVEDDFAPLIKAFEGAPLPDDPLTERDPAVILYTSGTTGRAKGAVHTHGNMTNMLMVAFFHGARLMAANPVANELPTLPNTVLVTSPLFHVSGLHCAAMTALGGGAKTVWPMGRFDPEAVLTMIEQERVTGWGYTATMLRRVVNHPNLERFDLSSLRSIGGGGSPISPELLARAREVFPQCHHTMGVGYGLTEGTAFATLHTGSELADDPTSVGRPVPVVDVEVRDSHGHPVADGIEGEIHLRGPLVMDGYWNDPEATSAAIKPGRWLKTGDIGHLSDGRLYIASRKRDLILRGGENVYPAEIEMRLLAHPNVMEAAVFGVDHADLGEEVKAVVVLRPGSHVSQETLQQWVSSELAYYKVPSVWQFRDAPLPRNATGKVLKQALRESRESTFIEE